MPREPADVFGLLRDARCDTLDAYQQQLLAARCRGGGPRRDSPDVGLFGPDDLPRLAPHR